MRWVTDLETEGRIIFALPWRGRYFGLVMSPDWSEFFVGMFDKIDG